MAPLSLSINVSWALIGNIAFAGSQWAVVAAIAKLGTPAMVGQFSLALALTAPVFMLTALSLRSVQAADARRDFDFVDYFLLRAASSTLALTAVAGILLMTHYDHDLVLVCAFVAVAKAFESLSDICYGLMQQRERMDRIAWSMVLRGGVGLLAVVLLLRLTGSLTLGVLGLTACWAAVFLLYDARKALLLSSAFARPHPEPRRWKHRWRRMRNLALLTLPLGVVMMLVSLNVNIPRYFVESTLGEEQLGYYSAIAYIGFAAATVVGAMGQAATAPLARHHALREPHSFTLLVVKLVAIAAFIGAFGWAIAELFGEAVLTLLYTPAYARHAELFAFFMAVTVVSLVSTVLGYAMTAMRRFKVQVPIFVLVVAVNYAACKVLIPEIQLAGAVWAVFASAAVQCVASAAVVAPHLRR
ncbi:MAG TPA: oligosaccharide flippase family protein [Gammaproteobacteria bacterium]